MRVALVVLALTVASLSAACSRPEAPKYDVGNAQVQGHYDRKTGKLTSITYDSNKNGKVDTWSYMDGLRVIRIEIDKDEDGKIDRWEYYTADKKLEKVGYSRANNGRPDAWAYQGADGQLAKIELAALPSGTSTPDSGLRTSDSKNQPESDSRTSGVSKRESDSGLRTPDSGLSGSIKIVRTEYYDNGKLARAEEDANGDGKIDKWETFVNGGLASVAFDTTGRGTPDRRLTYSANGAVKVEVDPLGTGAWKPAK